MRKIIVLVAHGTVEKLEELPDFLLEIRRGRPPTKELIAELEERYSAVGGSPHLAETRKQAAAVQEATGIETRVAMRLWQPRLEDVVSDLGPEDEVILVPLAPYSVDVYHGAAKRSLAKVSGAPQLKCVQAWGSLPELVQAHETSIRKTLDGVDGSFQLILTAHSLPMAVLARGDQYAVQFEECAKAVGVALGVDARIAYQSQGAMAGEWLGPTLESELERLKTEGVDSAVVAPIGFLSEHIETLYDLDIEAKKHAEQLGLGYHRVPALGTNEGLIRAIEAALKTA